MWRECLLTVSSYGRGSLEQIPVVNLINCKTTTDYLHDMCNIEQHGYVISGDILNGSSDAGVSR